MYKIIKIFISITILTFTAPVYANNSDILAKIENNIYGFEYSKDNTQNRVNRLEKTIYGKQFSGDINKRITKLSADISADVIGLETKPSKDTFLEDEYETEDTDVNYPIVNDIEQKLFNTTYKNRDFHTRIVTIEKKLFGKIYDVDDYSKRMERIKAKMYPQMLTNRNDSLSDGGSHYNDRIINSMDLSGRNYSRYSIPFGQKKYTRPYTNYGDIDSINGTVSPTDNLNDELTQLEYDTFGTEFSSDDTQTRIKRLNSANKAKKSSKKYDSQKFSQRMSTAMEIGAMILMILAMVL